MWGGVGGDLLEDHDATGVLVFFSSFFSLFFVTSVSECLCTWLKHESRVQGLGRHAKVECKAK